VSLLASLFSVVRCLVSRRAPGPEAADEASGLKRVANVLPSSLKAKTVPIGPPEPANMWFFEMVGQRDDRPFREAVKTMAVDDTFETDALLSQVSILARNVTEKHRWVNKGFVFTGTAFFFFATAIATHVVQLTE